MAVLIDTSILARLANLADAFHPTAIRAVVELHRRGESLRLLRAAAGELFVRRQP